ncbi:hypothetical protein ABZ858_00165 [Streptomyces sp. NPDC047017]|uniref:hypothetical protein n=1 Tax=Streptomyces sp. NPDC047017 TaxID=3155024 RepID=UPI0033E072EE
MASLKRPELTDGPKKELNAALHDLHLRAGLPSVRELVAWMGGGSVAGRSRVHDAFSSPRLPAWGLVQILTEALVSKIPGADAKQEELRFHQLWIAASGQRSQESARVRAPMSHQVPAHVKPQVLPTQSTLAMRVEWAAPAGLDIETRRSIREYVGRSLDDIGWPAKGEHRRDGSAGSVIVVNQGHEHPSLTAATFLATLDAAQDQARRFYGSHAAALRFMAYFNREAQSPHEAVDVLNDLWTSPDVNYLWNLQKFPGGWRPENDVNYPQEAADSRTELVSAVLCGLPIQGYFAGDWAPGSDYVPFSSVPPGTSDGRLAEASVRVSNTTDPWGHRPY